MMEGQQHGKQLKRSPKNHHIQLIALGDVVGTGSLLDNASVAQSVGPGIILGYTTVDFIAFLIICQLGEVVIEGPVTGSSSHSAYKYWGSPAGFAPDWDYWMLYVLIAMAELATASRHIQFWYPEISTWASAAVFFMMINAINLTDVKVFGEAEFWFTIIKIITVVAMIIFGGWLLFSGSGGPRAVVSNLWGRGGFLSHGFTGLVMMMATIMFLFGGLELAGVIVTEADNPERSMPKATNQVIYRILILCISSLAVLLSLVPRTRVTANTSSFVPIFHELDDTFVANAPNIMVLTATPSVYNSRVYCNSRMLLGLAQQGSAPRALASVDKRGVPINTVLVSTLVTVLCILINYLVPESTFGLSMALVVSALAINWAMISLVHTKFRRTKQEQNMVTHFLALLYPLGDWICLLFMAAALVITLMTPGMAVSVCLIPVWLIVLGIGYLLKEKIAKAVRAR